MSLRRSSENVSALGTSLLMAATLISPFGPTIIMRPGVLSTPDSPMPLPHTNGWPYRISTSCTHESVMLIALFTPMISGVMSGLPHASFGLGKFLHEKSGGNGYGQVIGSPSAVQPDSFACIPLAVTCVQC